MNYNEFLQTPRSFAVEVTEMLAVKKKWGLALTREEKMLQRHIRTLRLRMVGTIF